VLNLSGLVKLLMLVMFAVFIFMSIFGAIETSYAADLTPCVVLKLEALSLKLSLFIGMFLLL